MSLCAGKHRRLSSGEQKELGERPGRVQGHGPSTAMGWTGPKGLLTAPWPEDPMLLRPLPLQPGRKLTSAENPLYYTGWSKNTSQSFSKLKRRRVKRLGVGAICSSCLNYWFTPQISIAFSKFFLRACQNKNAGAMTHLSLCHSTADLAA